jgi:hypothetical protein
MTTAMSWAALTANGAAVSKINQLCPGAGASV